MEASRQFSHRAGLGGQVAVRNGYLTNALDEIIQLGHELQVLGKRRRETASAILSSELACIESSQLEEEVAVLCRDLKAAGDEIVRLRHGLEEVYGEPPRKTARATESAQNQGNPTSVLLNEVKLSSGIDQAKFKELYAVVNRDLREAREKATKSAQNQGNLNEDSTRSMSEKTQKADDTEAIKEATSKKERRKIYNSYYLEEGEDSDFDLEYLDDEEGDDMDSLYQQRALDIFLDDFVPKYFKTVRLGRISEVKSTGKNKWDSMPESEKDKYIKMAKARFDDIIKYSRELKEQSI